MAERTLAPAAAKKFYDRFGSKQDAQAWYEDAAIDDLIGASRFSEASSVFEFGCGTGRLAEKLLSEHLPEDATYHGIDISDTMLQLSRERLTRFGDRASVALHDSAGMPEVQLEGVDRFLSTYVLDLLPLAQAEAVLSWAFDLLRPGGMLCLAGITRGSGLLSRIVMGGWATVSRINPAWVGGCRPVVLIEQLRSEQWEIDHRKVVVAWGIASEVIVAHRR